MNQYQLLMHVAGIDARVAAAFHGVSYDTVKSWVARGRNNPPAKRVDDLRALVKKQEAAAQRLATRINESGARDATIHVYIDDETAQKNGWPSKSAHDTVAGIALSRIKPSVEVTISAR